MRRWLCVGVLALSACGGASDHLVKPHQITDDTIPEPLTDQPGDPARGELIFTDRDQGHCVLCHVVSGLDVPFQGNVGPDLTYVADRLTPEQVRLRIVDYQIVREGTVMPSYHRIHDLYQVEEVSIGSPLLAAQEVEDLVAYLDTLTSEAQTHE